MLNPLVSANKRICKRGRDKNLWQENYLRKITPNSGIVNLLKHGGNAIVNLPAILGSQDQGGPGWVVPPFHT
jgi:hypothetical protein